MCSCQGGAWLWGPVEDPGLAVHGCGLCTLSVAACRLTRASHMESCRGDQSSQLSLTELSLAFLSQRVFSDRGQLSGRLVGVDCADWALQGSPWSQVPTRVLSVFRRRTTLGMGGVWRWQNWAEEACCSLPG